MSLRWTFPHASVNVGINRDATAVDVPDDDDDGGDDDDGSNNDDVL